MCGKCYNNTTKERDWWNPTIKTIYDPCPNGYRIPKDGTYGEAKDWTLSEWGGIALKGGQLFRSSFFPFEGYRGETNGAYHAVGSSGYGWMSTPYLTSSAFLLIFRGNQELYSNDKRSRSNGFTTRCIKE